MKTNVKAILIPIIVLTVIAAVMAALLGGTNLLTKDKIAELSEESKQQAVEKVIKADEYQSATIKFENADKEYYKALKDKKCVGYAFIVSSNGYGGSVQVVVGMDTQGTITAIEILDVSNETPGLGQNAKNEDFTNQFADKSGPLEVVRGEAKDNEISAMTGATITSKAVTSAVNKASEMYKLVAKEG